MAEIRMVVQTLAGKLESEWQAAVDDDIGWKNLDSAADKLEQGKTVRIATSEGRVVIPAHAVVWIRYESR